jgi:hypothetical protein
MAQAGVHNSPNHALGDPHAHPLTYEPTGEQLGGDQSDERPSERIEWENDAEREHQEEEQHHDAATVQADGNNDNSDGHTNGDGHAPDIYYTNDDGLS